MIYLIEPERLARSLVTAVNSANLESANNPIWTRCVKDHLYQLLHGGGTDVLFTSKERKTTEFLLDIVAWNREDVEGIALAAECEWLLAPAEIVRDFEKLLVIKSALKLMIFASTGDKSQQNVLEAVKRSFMTYKHHVTGERYIFIDFAPPPTRAAHWFEVPASGRLEVMPQAKSIVLD